MNKSKKRIAEEKKEIKKNTIPIKKGKHPLCLGDGVDHCDYFSTVSCDECRFNVDIRNGKDPRAERNRIK